VIRVVEHALPQFEYNEPTSWAQGGILDFVRKMDGASKVVAAICHAAWVPISAGIVKGRRMTSYASVKDDCVNAGAKWVDKECVVDGTFITSRRPADLPAFCRAIVSALSK